MEKKFKGKFPSIMETQVLSNEMMSEIESGDTCEKSCQPGCKKACVNGNKNDNNGNGNDLELPSLPSLT